jgi:hypothetical protein
VAWRHTKKVGLKSEQKLDDTTYLTMTPLSGKRRKLDYGSAVAIPATDIDDDLINDSAAYAPQATAAK